MGGGGERAPPLHLGPSDPGTRRGGGEGEHTSYARYRPGEGGGGAANPIEPKQLSLIGDETLINLQRAKIYVFSDSVLCLRKVLQHPESNEAWKNRVAGVRAERSHRDYDAINGESTEFEWNIFPGFTTLQFCDKISDLLNYLGNIKNFHKKNSIDVNVQ